MQTITITINIPEATIAALCEQYGYKETHVGGAPAFAQECIVKFLKDVTVAHDYKVKMAAIQRLDPSEIEIGIGSLGEAKL